MIKVKGLFSVNKSKISVIFLFLLLTLTFVVSFKTKFVVHYDRLYGYLSQLSGSTLKFVNNWLVETPQKLHFLNFELPDSIEFNNLIERESYISYPSGCTFFVYVFAKLLGRQIIDISFLKHFQMICFWMETLLLAVFVYRFLKNIGIKSEIEKTVAAFLTAIFWAWMPTNVWYLANIYFADQCIILFVMAFLYVEYEFYCCKNNRARFILNLIKASLIFAGVLIDYYFWIFTFVAFVLQVVYSIKDKERISIIIGNALWYVIPVILAVSVFACQLLSVPDWKNRLYSTFLFRIGVTNTEIDKVILKSLYHYTVNGFGLKSNLNLLVLLILILCFHSDSIKISKKFFVVLKEYLFTNNGIIILLGTIAPILQIVVLKNHAAQHDFSIIKIAWIIAVFPVVFSVIYFKSINHESQRTFQFMQIFMISFLFIVFITGVPFSSMKFRNEQELELHDYHLAEILRDNTSYEHVCFSFTCSITKDLRNELAVSRKNVHKIDNKNELNTMFPNLNSQAVKIFVIDKDAVSELTDEQIAVQNELRSTNKVFFEDERFCLLELLE
ncbi:MAG: hypothetical protein II973_03645 [Spirochaetaceae bacterium]|nr:hypothetical protein [Spirochaetaceae bacterium]